MFLSADLSVMLICIQANANSATGAEMGATLGGGQPVQEKGLQDLVCE